MSERIAAVTGGSSGIGRAFVERLAHAGFAVVTISRASDHYAEARAAWRECSILALEGDLTQEEAAITLASELSRRYGRLDLLINCAGAYFGDDGDLPSVETLLDNLNINLVAQYRVILRCLPLLEKADAPKILNISSGAGSIGPLSQKGPLAYRTSKAGLNMLTRSLSFSLAEKNIRIYAVDPGYVKTRLNPDGTESPASAVDGIWPLIVSETSELSGQFSHRGQVLPW